MNASDVPLIVLKGLEGNPPANMYPMQVFLVPYVPLISEMLWVLWSAVLSIVLLKYVVGVDVIALFARATKRDHV